MSDSALRVLVTAASGIGHLHPLLPLTTALRDRGHDVRFAAPSDMHEAIGRAGFEAYSAGLTGAERREIFGREWGAEIERIPPAARPDFMFPRNFGLICVPPMLRDLRSLTAVWEPDLVLHDAAELAAPLFAAEQEIPRAAHSFGSTFPLHRIQAAGDMTADLWQHAGLTPPPYAGLFSDTYVDIRPASLATPAPTGTRELRERPVAWDAVGGELPPLATEPSDRPLVYLTLGTVFSDPDVLRTAVGAIAALPVRVVVTVGPQGDPSEVGAVPGHVTVVSYVPQTQLLEHCSVVVSHAGSGTFLGALARGIPQLCLPQGADQFINATDGARVGAALSLEPELATSDAIQAAVLRLLQSPEPRRVAERLAVEIAGMPSPDDVAAELVRDAEASR